MHKQSSQKAHTGEYNRTIGYVLSLAYLDLPLSTQVTSGARLTPIDHCSAPAKPAQARHTRVRKLQQSGLEANILRPPHLPSSARGRRKGLHGSKSGGDGFHKTPGGTGALIVHGAANQLGCVVREPLMSIVRNKMHSKILVAKWFNCMNGVRDPGLKTEERERSTSRFRESFSDCVPRGKCGCSRALDISQLWLAQCSGAQCHSITSRNWYIG